MKRKMLVLSCAVLLIAVVLTWFKGKTTEDDESVVYVDRQIEQLLNTKEYNDAGFEQQKIMVSDLLIELRKNKMIVAFSYSDDNKLYSFEYNDHSLGGVYLKGFSVETNILPTD